MIAQSKLFKKIGWEPHIGQKPVVEAFENKRNLAICAGRRWGKSQLCGEIALYTLLSGADKRVWVVSPTYELSKKVFNYSLKWLSKAAPSQFRKENITSRPFPRIKLDNGSWMECKSATEPQGLLGEELDLLIIDEASRIPKDVWETYLFATTASRKGKTLIIYTPFGKNWFYETWNRWHEEEENAAFQFSSKDNPYLPEGEWERAMNNLPETVFKQEYAANFLDDAAVVFRGVRKIVQEDILEDARFDRRYVLGVDLGKINDFSVLTVLDTYSHNVVYFDRFKEIDFPMQKARIKSVAQRYNNARIIIDSTGLGDPISDDLKREGLMVDDIKLSNKSKQQVVEKLSLYIEQGAVSIPNEDALIRELEAYTYDMTEFGKIRYTAPSGLHDDCVISLGLAVWGIDGRDRNNPNRLFNMKKKKKVGYGFV